MSPEPLSLECHHGDLRGPTGKWPWLCNLHAKAIPRDQRWGKSDHHRFLSYGVHKVQWGGGVFTGSEDMFHAHGPHGPVYYMDAAHQHSPKELKMESIGSLVTPKVLITPLMPMNMSILHVSSLLSTIWFASDVGRYVHALTLFFRRPSNSTADNPRPRKKIVISSTDISFWRKTNSNLFETPDHKDDFKPYFVIWLNHLIDHIETKEPVFSNAYPYMKMRISGFKWHWHLLLGARLITKGQHHRWSSDAGISRLGHPKMADAFPGNQLWGQISPSIGNRHSPDLDYITCIWVGMECDNRIWQKRHILCKRKGNKSRQDAGFSPSWVCHAAGSSIPGCRYLLGDASISSLDFVLTVTHPTYFIHLYIYGLWRRIETFMSSNFPK